VRQGLEKRLALMKDRRGRILKRLPEGIGVAAPGLRFRTGRGGEQVAVQSSP
jgi:hypothetical protein